MCNILFVTGSYPPDICGVGDYVSNILNSDIAKEKHFSLFYREKWSFKYLSKYISEILKINTSCICLQYPTQGYGWSLVPHILVAFFSIFTQKKTIVCLHEFSESTLKSKICSCIFLLFGNKIILTNEYEKEYASKLFPYIKKKISVVKISSNIIRTNNINPFPKREYDFVYFGHIRPLKGLEEFLTTMECILKDRPFLKVIIMGQVPKSYEDYADAIMNRCKDLNISILINMSDDSVANFLNSCKYAYLPFPDGVSERRGSFLACLNNGVVIATTRGKYTTKALSEISFIVNEELKEEVLLQILNYTEDEYQKKQLLGFNYLKNEIPSSWDEIALLYTKVL